MYNIVVYVPETHVEQVREAMFRGGGGKYNRYDSCSWQVAGTGQFRPLPGSSPFIGSAEKVEQVPEFRLEMICTEDNIRTAVAAMLKAHPYEEVAWHACRIMTASDFL